MEVIGRKIIWPARPIKVVQRRTRILYPRMYPFSIPDSTHAVPQTATKISQQECKIALSSPVIAGFMKIEKFLERLCVFKF